MAHLSCSWTSFLLVLFFPGTLIALSPRPPPHITWAPKHGRSETLTPLAPRGRESPRLQDLRLGP